MFGFYCNSFFMNLKTYIKKCSRNVKLNSFITILIINYLTLFSCKINFTDKERVTSK